MFIEVLLLFWLAYFTCIIVIFTVHKFQNYDRENCIYKHSRPATAKFGLIILLQSLKVKLSLYFVKPHAVQLIPNRFFNKNIPGVLRYHIPRS
jgi:hypothetical protein